MTVSEKGDVLVVFGDHVPLRLLADVLTGEGYCVRPAVRMPASGHWVADDLLRIADERVYAVKRKRRDRGSR